VSTQPEDCSATPGAQRSKKPGELPRDKPGDLANLVGGVMQRTRGIKS